MLDQEALDQPRAASFFFFKILNINRIMKYETLLEGNFTPERDESTSYAWNTAIMIYDTVELPVTGAKWSVGTAPLIPQSSIKKETKMLAVCGQTFFILRSISTNNIARGMVRGGHKIRFQFT
jgi:hypothetical protein